MASKAIRGITVEIGGDTTKLGKALGDVESKTGSLQRELKQVEQMLKFDPENTELLAQRQQLLTEAVGETSKKLALLEEAQSQVVEQFEKGEIGEDQMRAFQREIIQTRSKLSGFKNDLAGVDAPMESIGDNSTKSATALEKLTAKIDEQETELKQLKDEYTNVVLEQGESSKEAKTLAKEMESLNSDLKQSKKQMDKAESAANDLADGLDNAGDEASGSGDGFTIMGGALADLTSSAIQGCVSAIGDFIGSLLELSEATEEYRSMQAKLEGSANTFGYSTEYASEQYKNFYGYLGDDQMATNAITNLMGIGTSTESLSAIAEGAIGVWASYGDSIPIESLTESINETIRVGER